MYVAVHAVDVHFLHKCHSNVKDLKFVSGPGWVDRTGIGLGPSVNCVYRSLDGNHDWNRYMFFGVSVIGKVWFERRALADILRLHLTDIETPAR